jgi:hypothetical protein
MHAVYHLNDVHLRLSVKLCQMSTDNCQTCFIFGDCCFELRGERQRTEITERIMEAVRLLFVRDGYDAVTLRRIAPSLFHKTDEDA